MESTGQAPRICIASSGLGHVTRGIEAWAGDLGRSLAELGEPVLLCKGAGNCEADHERIVRCWTRNSRPTQRLLALLPKSFGWRVGLGAGYGVEQTTFAMGLLPILRKEQVDILHLQDPQVAVLMQRARTAGWIRTRTILNHGTEEPPEFLKKITYLQHGAPPHRDEAVAAGNWKNTWEVIPNFVNVGQFQPGEAPLLRRSYEIPQDAIVVFSSAAIKRSHKRIDYLIREVAQAQQLVPGVPLWLVVAGSRSQDTDELMREAQSSLGSRIRFVINHPRRKMPELYQMADILVHGSLKEMMPMALLEALASGLPCLVHHHPVMTWMVGPGGIALDLTREGGLASCLTRLVTNERARRDLGQLARSHCLRNFSTRTVLKQILSYYKFVHQHGRRTRTAA